MAHTSISLLQERDAETGLDFFEARYSSGAQGRFTSPDPLGINLLRVLSPQRWNMYAYVVNNPLAYTDPDGRDALAVTFSTGAQGLGHAGFATVHTDGTTRFADFSPKHSDSFHDEGQYTFANLNARVVYSNGKPTKDSLVAIANELADREGVPPESVHVAYFKASGAETAMGDAYIDDAEAREKNHTQPSYWGGIQRLYIVLLQRPEGNRQHSRIASVDGTKLGMVGFLASIRDYCNWIKA